MILENIVSEVSKEIKAISSNIKKSFSEIKTYVPLAGPVIGGAAIGAAAFYSSNFLPMFFAMSAGFGLIGLTFYALSIPFWRHYYRHN